MKIYQKNETINLRFRVREFKSQNYISNESANIWVYDSNGIAVIENLNVEYDETYDAYFTSFNIQEEGLYSLILKVGTSQNMSILRYKFKVVDVI